MTLVFHLIVATCVWANQCQEQKALEGAFLTKQECVEAAAAIERQPKNDSDTFIAYCRTEAKP